MIAKAELIPIETVGYNLIDAKERLSTLVIFTCRQVKDSLAVFLLCR